MNNYWQRLDAGDKATLEEKVNAIYNVLNNVSREMSIGRVPRNNKELQENINLTKQKLTKPLSIAFVKMAESGEIDEVTASENVDMFLSWDSVSSYNSGDLRKYTTTKENENGEIMSETKLYKCLQAHTGQADWTPDVSLSLWKVTGINENGIPEWSQPISSSDAYNTGDEVMYNGVHYCSTIDNNVWSPSVYPVGWEVVE